MSEIALCSPNHNGTHNYFPSHFNSNGKTLIDYPVKQHFELFPKNKDEKALL